MMKPAAGKYRIPAEWEPHAATWLAWPHFAGDWPGKFEPIPWYMRKSFAILPVTSVST